MQEKDKRFFINNPIFIKWGKRLNLRLFKRELYVKKVFINERIIEIPFVLRNLPVTPGINILDLGCSESALPLYLASSGYKVTGVDFRPYPYSHPNLSVLCSDILKLPFRDEKFDVIVSISTLEHIGIGFYDDPKLCSEADRLAVREMARVLKKKGLLLLSVPFGKYQVNSQQRIYDSAHLNALFSGLLVEQRLFFANRSGSGNNYWEKVSEQEAVNIDSTNGSTQCVSLLAIRK